MILASLTSNLPREGDAVKGTDLKQVRLPIQRHDVRVYDVSVGQFLFSF
jgi:hypothetical protein